MELLADVGGKPGVDCRGFCSYCYFKKVKEFAPFGCRHCSPLSKGCDYCGRAIAERYPGFKPLLRVAQDIQATLAVRATDPNKVTISGGGDVSCYPDLGDLAELLASLGVPIHLGYTSGKGFDNQKDAETLIENNVREVSFTVFATEPYLRKRYMADPSPEVSLECLAAFCSACDVYGAAVIIPGINDGAVLQKTCDDLEDMGAKGLILMRFANHAKEGLILGNAPLIHGIEPQSIESFKELVSAINGEYSMRITGTPLWDPTIGSPFYVASNPEHYLPRTDKGATLITGEVASPYLRSIFKRIAPNVNVVSTEKEIACLITMDDIQQLSLSDMQETVIIPGRTLVHDKDITEALRADGTYRILRRGPEQLTVDGEMSISMTRDQILQQEIEAFTELIRTIEAVGI
ncbi:MAG: methyl coenzyme M reductase-arginine methyltransferase Mmp10 [Halobacteriota archaeon]